MNAKKVVPFTGKAMFGFLLAGSVIGVALSYVGVILMALGFLWEVYAGEEE